MSGHKFDDNEARITVPEHVVARRLGDDTVLLNLRTGRYHGLDRVGAEMLEELAAHGSVSGAAAALACLYDAPLPMIERDLTEFCRVLYDRELIAVDDLW